MSRRNDEDLWYWYQHLEACRASGLTVAQYCRERDLEYAIFAAMRYKILYRKYNNPEQYAKFVALGREYLASEMKRDGFCKYAGINARTLTDIVWHLNAIDRIEEIKQFKGNEPMNFIQVPKVITTPNIYKKPKQIAPVQVPQHAEVTEARNDIELIISKGVKVIISPNVDAMKIIKIIELLKDL